MAFDLGRGSLERSTPQPAPLKAFDFDFDFTIDRISLTADDDG
jgi:hypothetical protein